MDKEIVLERDREGYRVVAGRHSLDASLAARGEVFADVVGEPGRAKVFRGENRWLVCKDSRHLPLLDAPTVFPAMQETRVP